MSDVTIDEYGESVGSVMVARKEYEALCASEGPDSSAAQGAHEHLAQQVQHREIMRKLHDAAPNDPSTGSAT